MALHHKPSCSLEYLTGTDIYVTNDEDCDDENEDISLAQGYAMASTITVYGIDDDDITLNTLTEVPC